MGTGPDRNVLVVDDEPVIIRLLTEVLEEAGFRALAAPDGEAALTLLESEPIGVAILDKNLPGALNGLDILREVRKQSPHTRVVMLTAYPSTASTVEALRLGAFDYLEKPTDNTLLIEKVKRAWDSHAAAVARAELLRTYETLFEVIPGVVWFMTDGGTIRRISRQGAALLGYQPDELIGQSYEGILDLETADGAAHWAFKERRSGARATRRLPVTLRTRSGEKRIFELSAAAAYDEIDGELTPGYRGTLGVGWDITEHRNLLQQMMEASKMDALGRLAGGVAHDVNNVLSVITTSASFLNEEPGLSEAGRNDVEEILSAADRAAALTKRLLLVSRKNPARAEPIRLGDLIANLRGMLARLLREDIRVVSDVDPDLGTITADSGQIEQVVINLAVNARDAMPDGGVLTISVTNATVEKEYADAVPNHWPGQFVLLAVSDTGQGLSAEAREHLFEPFFTTKKPGEGTGLGLSIVYSVVRQAGGYINVYSEPGLGTTFKAYLPRTTAQPETRPRRAVLASYAGSETILLVEDDDAVRRAARRILERASYRVIEARDGAGGLAAWNVADHVDLLLTDVVMPEMSGAELALALRGKQPDLPIVYVSGYLGDLAGKAKLLAERASFVSKPFTAERLLRNVRELLDASGD